MGLSRKNENFKLFAFDIEAQLVAGLGTYVETIALGNDRFNVCHVTIWNKLSAHVVANAQRVSAYITATKDVSKGFGQGVRYTVTVVQGYSMTYYVPNYRYSGFSYAVDSQLTPPAFDSTGVRVLVEKAVINGSDLEITFRNTVSANSYIYAQGVIKAETLIEAA